MHIFLNSYAHCRLVLAGFILVASLIAGCTQTLGGEAAYARAGPGGCTSPAACMAYCQVHTSECDQFCRDHGDLCIRMGGAAARITAGAGSQQGFETGTACDTPALRQKMSDAINKILVSPPSAVRAPNWQTKILPAGNPYPGYYYDLSTAFGPAIDSATTSWTGMGEPPRTPGLDYYIVGYWEEVPKGAGGNMGENTPGALDLSRYQLAVFYTNVTGRSQAAMIEALPSLTMSESEARAFFASRIKKSFIDLDTKTLTRAGNGKMYEASWHDSTDTQNYWNVQVGIGYLAIGQGKVYTEEAQLRGDPGTIWRYHACRPCENCRDWIVETALNKDCTTDSDCLGGLSGSAGYCVNPKGTASFGKNPAAIITNPGGIAGKGAPGSSCSTAADCGSGLSCMNGACAIPSGPM